MPCGAVFSISLIYKPHTVNEALKKTFFERTLVLARKGWGETHPNPMVGAVIVEDEKIVSEGYHKQAGSPHAEVEAIRGLGREPRESASIFVSLEPCSTIGRTPPCVQGILDAGIKQVFVGTTDPNPLHSGRGIEMLRESGIQVEMATSEFQSKATRLNFIFNHNITTGHPLISLKLAESSNGMLTEVRGQPSRVTEEQARLNMMTWRRLFPAIALGSGTVLADNPSLTSRLPQKTFCPVRIVFDAKLSTFGDTVSPRDLYTDEFSSKTKVITTSTGLNNKDSVSRANDLGIHLIQAKKDGDGRIDLSDLREFLKEHDLNALYCEGGAKIAQSLLNHNLIDYLFRYQSPKLFEGPNALAGPDLDHFEIKDSITQKLGEDILTHGFL